MVAVVLHFTHTTKVLSFIVSLVLVHIHYLWSFSLKQHMFTIQKVKCFLWVTANCFLRGIFSKESCCTCYSKLLILFIHRPSSLIRFTFWSDMRFWLQFSRESVSLRILVSTSGLLILPLVGVCVTPYLRRRNCPEFWWQGVKILQNFNCQDDHWSLLFSANELPLYTLGGSTHMTTCCIMIFHSLLSMSEPMGNRVTNSHYRA